MAVAVVARFILVCSYVHFFLRYSCVKSFSGSFRSNVLMCLVSADAVGILIYGNSALDVVRPGLSYWTGVSPTA